MSGAFKSGHNLTPKLVAEVYRRQIATKSSVAAMRIVMEADVPKV